MKLFSLLQEEGEQRTLLIITSITSIISINFITFTFITFIFYVFFFGFDFRSTWDSSNWWMISELPPWIAYCHNEDVNAAFFVHKYWNIWVEPKNAAYCINAGHPFSIKNELVSNIENLFLKSSGNLAMTGNYPSEYQIKWKIDTVHLYIREVPRQ